MRAVSRAIQLVTVKPSSETWDRWDVELKVLDFDIAFHFFAGQVGTF